MFENCILEVCDQAGSDLPIPWSPEPCKELVRGGVQTYSTSSPHLCKLQGSHRFHILDQQHIGKDTCAAECRSVLRDLRP